jgi:ComF family protein
MTTFPNRHKLYSLFPLNLFSGILDFFYPPFCQFCWEPLDDPRLLVCNNCWSSFEPYGDFSIKFHAHLRSLDTVMVGLLGEAAIGDPLNQIIHQLKYDRRETLAGGLAGRIAMQLEPLPWVSHVDVVVPVPLHPSRMRGRGYNQSQLIADHLGNMFNVSVVPKVLIRTRATESQTRLNKEQRRKNVAGAFRVQFPDLITGHRILLVDDVVTTGATLNECAKTLRKAGALDVYAAAAVHFQRPLP